MRVFFLFLFVSGFLPAAAHAACTAPSADVGEIIYNYDHDIFQGCTALGWKPFNRSDNTPGPIAFTDLIDQPRSTLTFSEIVQVKGITLPVATSISGSGASYRVCMDQACGNVITNWTTGASTIQNNQYLQVRMTTSANHNTVTATTMTVGPQSLPWSLRTDINIMRDGSLSNIAGGPAPWLDGSLIYANDGDIDNPWFGRTVDQQAGNNDGRGLTLTFNSAKTIKKIIIHGYNVAHTANIQYWNGASWVSVVTHTGPKAYPQVYTFNEDGAISATMWRWYISGWNPGYASNYYGWEFEAYE